MPTPAPPGASDEVVRLDVSCSSPLLIGQRSPCLAVATMRSGNTDPLATFRAGWSSSHPDVASIEANGVVTGRSAGSAVLLAFYGGREGRATSEVIAVDAVRVEAAADQGEFRRGSTVTMHMQGYYSIASADSGRLSLQISDQNGVFTGSAPMTVARGGAFFLLSSTFVVPERSTEVCRTVLLQVGSTSIVEPSSNQNPLRCLPVRP